MEEEGRWVGGWRTSILLIRIGERHAKKRSHVSKEAGAWNLGARGRDREGGAEPRARSFPHQAEELGLYSLNDSRGSMNDL